MDDVGGQSGSSPAFEQHGLLEYFSPIEVALGLKLETRVGSTDPLLDRPLDDPAEELRTSLARLLQSGPVSIAFSGGLDSALLLVAAVEVARREGLPLPVPVSLRFDDAPEANETEYQRGMIEELGLDQWCIVRVEPGELDYAGSTATHVRQRLGLHWPPATHLMVPLLRASRGTTLVHGQGGDELFVGWRTWPGLWARRKVPSRGHRVLRGWIRERGGHTDAVVRALRHPLPRAAWLTSRGRVRAGRWTLRSIAIEPGTRPEYLRWRFRSERWRAFQATMSAVSGSEGVPIAFPLADASFVEALARTSSFHELPRDAVYESLSRGRIPVHLLRRVGRHGVWRCRGLIASRLVSLR